MLTLFANGQTKLTTTEKASYNRFLNKGIETYNAGRLNEALESFKRAEALDPDAWKLNYWMAACHYELNSYYTAEICLKMKTVMRHFMNLTEKSITG
jgi:Tfp pilus assembly protein PilF